MRKQLVEDWEFNILGVLNYRKHSTKKRFFEFIVENHDVIEGDIVETGVFKGSSILATGLLLKELGSNKKVYGFDSFSGFPTEAKQNDNDNLDCFKRMSQEGIISLEHYEKIVLYLA